MSLRRKKQTIKTGIWNLPFKKTPLEKLKKIFHISTLTVKVRSPNSTHQLLVTCCSWGCCLLCFLAGRGGGVSFKGKGSIDGAMTSGHESDGGWVTGWAERVEGNTNPEQTGELCFVGERKSICVYMKWKDMQRNETDKLIISLFCFVIFQSRIINDGLYLSI